jgi:fatty acyl-CoA reductase
MGKALTQKLLWSCPDIENIYIIVRSKKGKAVQERVNEITINSAFDRIRARNPDDLKKIIALEGDITLDNFGMSDKDLEIFYEKVNVIYHSAASVKLNEPPSVAIETNVLPNKRLLAMSRKIKNLEVF